MITRTARTVLAVGTMLALLAPAGIALAEDDDGIERHGACTGAARWELDAEREGARLEAEFEVDRARATGTWHVRIRHDGHLVADVDRVAGADHEFEVRALTPNGAGSDAFFARAVERATGQVCRGSLTYPA